MNGHPHRVRDLLLEDERSPGIRRLIPERHVKSYVQECCRKIPPTGYFEAEIALANPQLCRRNEPCTPGNASPPIVPTVCRFFTCRFASKYLRTGIWPIQPSK